MPIAETAVGVAVRPPRRPLPAAAAGRAARRHRGRARGDVQALRDVQAPHDAGRLRRLDARHRARSASAGAARARAAGNALPLPPRAAVRRVTVAVGRRERTKAANRAAILRRGARGVRRARLRGRSRVRDIVRRTGAGLGHVLQLLPRQGRGLRARSSRRRVPPPGGACRAARGARATARELVEARLPRVLRVRRRGPGDASRSCAATSRAAAVGRARAPARRRRAGRGPARAHEAAAGAGRRLLAHAMVAVGVELGARMAEREPPDVEGATRFATRAVRRGGPR